MTSLIFRHLISGSCNSWNAGISAPTDSSERSRKPWKRPSLVNKGVLAPPARTPENLPQEDWKTGRGRWPGHCFFTWAATSRRMALYSGCRRKPFRQCHNVLESLPSRNVLASWE